jgi:hypothetical protein
MRATDLQHSLAHLAPGETLLLPAIEIEQAFPFRPNREVWLAEVTNLAGWYRCRVTLCGPDENQILFTRHDDLDAVKFAEATL